MDSAATIRLSKPGRRPRHSRTNSPRRRRKRAGPTESAGSWLPTPTTTRKSGNTGGPRARATGASGSRIRAGPPIEEKSLPAAELRFRREEVSLYELPDASPMAFDRANPRTPLPIEFHGWGAEVEVPGKGQRTVVVNIVVRPWLRAACGRQPLESSADEWGRMEVRVPDGVTPLPGFLRSALAAGNFRRSRAGSGDACRHGPVRESASASGSCPGLLTWQSQVSRYNGVQFRRERVSAQLWPAEGEPSHAMPTSA